MKNSKTTLIVTAIGTVLCTIARLYSIVACTDMNTGFYYYESELLCNIIYFGLIALTLVGALIATRFDKKNAFGGLKASDITGGKAAVIGFGTLILALCAVYEGMGEAKQLTPSSMLMIVDYVFAGVFAVLAFVVLYKKEFKPGLGFCYSAGGAYFIMRGIYCFNNRMVIASVPEYLIEVLCLVGGAVSIMMIARFLSGNGEKFTKNALCGWGASTVALTLSSGLAAILADLFAPEEISSRITPSVYEAELYRQTHFGIDGYMMVYLPYVDIAMGLFVAAVMIVLFFAKPKNEPETAETAENPETGEN